MRGITTFHSIPTTATKSASPVRGAALLTFYISFSDDAPSEPLVNSGAAQQLPAATERYAFRGGSEIGGKREAEIKQH